MVDTPLVISAEVEGLDSFEALDRSLEQIEEASEALSKAFQAQDKQTSKTSKSLQKSAKSCKAVERASEDLSEKLEATTKHFRDMGELGGPLADKLDQLGVVMSGPLGAAIGGLIVGIGAVRLGFAAVATTVDLTSKAILAFIASSEEATAQQKALTAATNDLAIAFGRAVVGGDNVISTMRRLEIKTARLGQIINQESEGIRVVFQSLATLFVGAVGIYSAMILSHMTVFVAAAESYLNIVKGWFLIYGNLVKYSLSNLRTAFSVLGLETQGLDTALSKVDQTLSKLKSDMGYPLTSKFVDLTKGTIDLTTSLLDLIWTNEKLDQSVRHRGVGMVGGEKPSGTAPSGRAPSGRAPLGVPSPTGSWAGEVALSPDPFFEAIQAGPGEGFGQASSSLQEYTLSHEHLQRTLEASQGTLEKWFRGLREAHQPLLEMVSIVQSFGSAFLDASTAMVGGFMAGVGTLSELGDSILDTLGNLANDIGDFFLKWGLLEALVNPWLGAAMIAGAVALKGFGGYLSGKGSGNRGSGSGAGGGTNEITRQIARSLAPDRDSGPRTIEVSVQIGTKQIEPEIVSILGQAQRLRRLNLQGA